MTVYYSPSRDARHEQRRRQAVADLLARHRETRTVDLTAHVHPPTFLQVAAEYGFDVAAQRVNRWMEDGTPWNNQGGAA